jgi:hypothetical protein
MKRLFFVFAALAATAAIAVPMSLAATKGPSPRALPNDFNGTAALVHIGPNMSQCSYGTPPAAFPGTDSGVVNVHYNKVQGRFMVNLSVHDAQPNTTYVVDVRCWTFGPQSEIGTVTTNSQGTGTAQVTLEGVTPVNPFYIDISVKNGGGGAGNYGDTFIAGPFTLG